MAEHLRNTHLSLMLLCFVLLVALFQPGPRPYKKALDDLEAISGLRTRNVSVLVDAEVRRYIDENHLKVQDRPALVWSGSLHFDNSLGVFAADPVFKVGPPDAWTYLPIK